MKRLTRVLHVFGSLEVGGAETWLLAILRGWGSSRYEHHICLLGLHDGPLITHVGSLTRQKNQGFLLRIFAEARRLRPDIKLVVAGEGPLRLELEQAIRTLRLLDSVRLLGERDDVPQVLMTSDGFVLTSRFEGSPLSLLEAQAAGLPCLVPSHVASVAGDGAENGVAQVGLDEAVQVWAGALAAVVDQPRRSAVVACRSLRDLGYDIATSRGKMEAVYEGEIDHHLRPEERASLVAEGLGNSAR